MRDDEIGEVPTWDDLVPLLRAVVDAVDRLAEIEYVDAAATSPQADGAVQHILDARLDFYRCLQAMGWVPPADAETVLLLDEAISRMGLSALERSAIPTS